MQHTHAHTNIYTTMHTPIQTHTLDIQSSKGQDRNISIKLTLVIQVEQKPCMISQVSE